MSLTFTNCQVEEESLKKESNIETVSVSAAISFLREDNATTSSQTGKKITLQPNFDQISQEKITYTNQLLTVIPIINKQEKASSRILLLKIEKELKSVAFTMYPDDNTTTASFTGKILMQNLNGSFINGYKVKEGIITAQYVKKNQNNAITSKDIIIDKVTFTDYDVVIVKNYYHNPRNSVNFMSLYTGFADTGSEGNSYGMNWDYGNGGGGGGSPATPTKDPCIAAQESTIVSKNKEYLTALKAINEANATEEHSITLGKASDGTMTQAPMNNGGQYIVQTNTDWAGAFAALHNHPNNTPLSAGDIYASVQLNVKNSSFTTSYILTNGEVYAIVVTNLSLAQDFVKTYPADQLPNQSPEFPNDIFYEIDGLKSIMGYGNEGRTTAIAFILDKYSAGITLLKQDSSGKFNPIKTQETTQSNGIKTYNTIPCY